MTIFHFADLQQSVQNLVLNFQSVQLQYSYSTATVQYSTVQYSYSYSYSTATPATPAVASYGATPAQHEALDGNRRGVEGVLREYIDTALYYHPS